ncbi:hypothetical protein OHC33_002992 [Knufia fluminis]|uniref:polynucleotide adenylyltransferase n=1 Tax=Knufia fluminis TaxID=191047 RepID=A0AAN8EUR7_9EURO|nr:hypothetical protein OHC33_002992 [Knufia fluminis]
MDSTNSSGFNPRVQDQLAQISQNQRDRRSSQSSVSSSSQASYYSQYNTHIHPRNSHYPRGQHAYMPRQPSQNPPGLDAFPPLGSAPPVNTYNMPQHTYQTPQPAYPGQHNYQTPSAAQEFFSRSRGRGRGRGNRQPTNRMPQVSADDYARPPPQNQRIYMPNANLQFGNPEQQRISRQRNIEQTDYLNELATKSLGNMLSREEIGQKQQFSQKLESIARQVVQRELTAGNDMQRAQIKLQPYGSLANSFGTAGCDVDLLLTVQKQTGSFMEISEEVKRDLEKVLLDQGIGARLLTNTRVPILRVCEKPNPELLKALRDYRAKWEASLLESESPLDQRAGDTSAPLPALTESQEEGQLAAMADLDLNAAEIALPDSPVPDHAKLEFVGDCGIQCDINFSNHIALHNSRLLWTYGQCDPRVRHLGIFVKNWAKARDINTPYRGTLSSYGYILMVLHYLINVAHPPLLPNLQEMAKDNGWSQAPPVLFEGHDITFTDNPNVIRQHMANMQRNNTSLGGLLLGFFRYYGTPQGFRFVEQVISIRSPGGILPKEHKGWTKAKWSEENTNVRQRYLLALEDPFEIDHNVGRTVGHNGIVAVRDEFRRAWNIIQSIQRVSTPHGQSWMWDIQGRDESGEGFDLIKPSESRGDTLRKDADARKARQMREKLEQQHVLALKNKSQGENEGETGMLIEREDRLAIQAPTVDDPAGLIHDVQHQDEKVSKMRSRQPERQRQHEDETEEDESLSSEANPKEVTGSEQGSVGQARGDIESDTINTSSWNQSFGQSQDGLWKDAAPVTEGTKVIPENFTNMSQPEALNGDTTDSWSGSFQGLPEEQALEPEAVLQITKDIPIDPTNISQPDPQNHEATNHWSTGRQEQAAEQPPDPECVGEHIEWTTKSKAGLWLLNRDKRIREGAFKAPTAADVGRLNAKFPYNKFMTKEELARMNKRLEELYKDSYYPKRSVEPASQSPESDKVVVGVTTDVSNINWQSQSTITNESEHSKPIQDWSVGSDILWSLNTDAGDWLRWRDRRVKEGKWKDDLADQSLSQRLNRLFPCDSEKTIANIDRMNTELDTFFADLRYPKSRMTEDERRDDHAKMHQAIDKLIDYREAQLKDGQSCPPAVQQSNDQWSHVDVASGQEQCLSSWQKGELEATHAENPRAMATLHGQIYAPAKSRPIPVKHSERDQAQAEVEDGKTRIRWPIGNSIGSWLQQRDEFMDAGTWHGEPDENSVFSRLNSLYPHDYTRSPSEQERLNQEITTYFNGVELPGLGFGSAEPVYRALLKVVEGRKDHAETKRVKFLLDLFSENTIKELKEVRGKPVLAPNPQQRQEIDERSMRAVQALSNQLSSNQLPPPVNDVDDLRRRRLAFFTKDRAQSASPNNEPAIPPPKDAANSVRRDSAAEGSWNDPPSPSKSLDPRATPFVPHTDSPKPTGTTDSPSQPPTPQSGNSDVDADPFAPKRQHDPATTDESAGELIPKTLQPDTWRTNRKHRHEDPRIIPFPRTLDFPFDAKQLADIECIRGGGNGCVRGGQSPYMLESDRHSWGGGGAMAQETESLVWSWSKHGHMYCDSGVGLEGDGDGAENVKLLGELPGVEDLAGA